MPKEWTDIASVGKFKLQRQIRGMRGPHSADSISSSSEKAWFTPVVSGWGLLLIIISMITFGYWFVYYSYLPNNALPAILMFLLLTGGVVLAKVLVGFRVLFSRFDISVLIYGVGTFLALIVVQTIIGFFVSSVTLGFQTVGGSGIAPVQISKFWIMMFYFSVGVAEEAFFSLFMLSVFLNIFRFKLGAIFSIVLDAAFFMMYHSAVITTLYPNTIYQGTPYIVVLFTGAIVLRTMFYYTRAFAVPAIGHGFLNLFVTSISLGLVTIPGVSGGVLSISPITFIPMALLSFGIPTLLAYKKKGFKFA